VKPQTVEVQMVRFLLSVHRVTILNSRFVSSRGLGGSETGQKAGKHTYFHQLNGRKLLVDLYSAISEGVQLYSQIYN
jgi:hypothetical protein